MSEPIPIYFESSWSILSSIGLVNVLIGFIVVGITSFSPITVVPIVVSAAAAIANGLCYYAFYETHAKAPTAAAAAIADVLWGIQEAGLSFYSYQILIRILQRRQRNIFICGYWGLILTVLVFKVMITLCRLQDILSGSLDKVALINRLHIGYFLGIATVEGLSSCFLLRKFFSARSTSRDIDSKVGLFSYLMRSTELRVSTLMFIGITRTITYSFQTTAQSATQPTGQIDRFVVVLECMFPIVMYIDILAAKGFGHSDYYSSSTRHGARQSPHSRYVGLKYLQNGKAGGPGGYPITHGETWVDVGERSSSQEYIMGADQQNAHEPNGSESVISGKNGEINKTVEFEFEFHTSMSPV